jgi:hypothetical protein
MEQNSGTEKPKLISPLDFLTSIGGMTSITVVPAERGFARTISTAPLSDGIQAC